MIVTGTKQRKTLTLFQVLRELRGPVSALAVLMLLVNVSLVSISQVVAGADSDAITLITCLNPDRSDPGTGPDGDRVSHDCVSCCLSTVKDMATPGLPGEVGRTVIAVAEKLEPPVRFLTRQAGGESAPIRAPPHIS